MEEEYDAIICGTGLTECVISGLLAIYGYKVLHVDRNQFYGGEAASLNLNQLYTKFNKGTPPDDLGKNYMYNLDLIPKVLMCAGDLVKILKATVVDRYDMEFLLIENSYVFKGNKIHKVPSTEKEALTSSLMGFFEKRSAAKFFSFMQQFEPNKPDTHKGYNLNTLTMQELFKKFSLGNDTIDFIGHAVALHNNDDYLTQSALETVMKCKLYEESFGMYGSSPYVYPMYGLGELPQAFSRLCAVYGGTFMLDTPVENIKFNDDGEFKSIDTKHGSAKGKFIVADSSYLRDKVKPIGKAVRCIAIMDHPIPGLSSNDQSCQIIIPQRECNRKNDIYVLQLSGTHKVCPPGKFVAIVGSVVENDDNPVLDIVPGLKLLGPILEKFVTISGLYSPIDDGSKSKCYLSQSYDPATHFESTADDILKLFKQIHGKEFNFDELTAKINTYTNE